MAIGMEKHFNTDSRKTWAELEGSDTKVELGPKKMSGLKGKIAVLSSALLMLLSTSCTDKTAFENTADRYVQTEKALEKANKNLIEENEDVKEAQSDLTEEKNEAKIANQEQIDAKKAHDEAKAALKKEVAEIK